MTRTATNRPRLRFIAALLCTGLFGSGCAGHASSTATAPTLFESTETSQSTTAPTTTTRPPTTTAGPPTRIEADGGVTLVVPARLDVRVARTSIARDDDPILRGTIVEIAAPGGPYLNESFEISFPRRDQPAVAGSSNHRVAYLDPTAARWVALPATVSNDRLAATANIAASYALVQWGASTLSPSSRQRWPLPDRAARLDLDTPQCDTAPPPWLRDIFTFANSASWLKTCIASIPGGVRLRIVNNTTIPLPIMFSAEPTSITFIDIPDRARAIHPYLESRRTSRTVLAGPGVTFVADFTAAPELDGAITVHLDEDPAFSSILFFFEIIDLAAPGRNSLLGLLASSNRADGRPLDDDIAKCVLDEPITNPTWQSGNPFPYVRKTTDCVVSRIENAIVATLDARTVEETLRVLHVADPAKERALGLAIALRNMLRGVDTVAMYWDLLAAQPHSPGDELVLTWGPQPRTTTVVENLPSLLFGVPLGADAEQAITALTRVLRQPTSESEWMKGCPLSGTPPMIRMVRWGALQVNFTRYSSGDRFDGWFFEMRNDYGPAVGGPMPERFIFRNGVKLGMSMGEVSDALGHQLHYWSVFQHLSVNDEGTHDYGRKQYFGVGADSPETKFTGYAEPGLAYCE